MERMCDLTYQMHLQHLEEVQAYARTAGLLRRAQKNKQQEKKFSRDTLSIVIHNLFPAFWSRGRIHSGVEFWADR